MKSFLLWSMIIGLLALATYYDARLWRKLLQDEIQLAILEGENDALQSLKDSK